MVPLPGTGSNVRSVDMQFTQVAYGGCWKCPHDWQRCSASTPCLAASQKGFVHSFGTGIGLVALLQSLIVMVSSLPMRSKQPRPYSVPRVRILPPGTHVKGSMARRTVSARTYRLTADSTALYQADT